MRRCANPRGSAGLAFDDIGARLARYRGLFDLTGRTAVVLGAASGIGKASAEVLTALGAKVICADRVVRLRR